MSDARWSAFLVTLTISVLVTFLSLEVDAQSTVDDSGSCESSTLDEAAVNVIREEFKTLRTSLDQTSSRTARQVSPEKTSKI